MAAPAQGRFVPRFTSLCTAQRRSATLHQQFVTGAAYDPFGALSGSDDFSLRELAARTMLHLREFRCRNAAKKPTIGVAVCLVSGVASSLLALARVDS